MGEGYEVEPDPEESGGSDSGREPGAEDTETSGRLPMAPGIRLRLNQTPAADFGTQIEQHLSKTIFGQIQPQLKFLAEDALAPLSNALASAQLNLNTTTFAALGSQMEQIGKASAALTQQVQFSQVAEAVSLLQQSQLRVVEQFQKDMLPSLTLFSDSLSWIGEAFKITHQPAMASLLESFSAAAALTYSSGFSGGTSLASSLSAAAVSTPMASQIAQVVSDTASSASGKLDHEGITIPEWAKLPDWEVAAMLTVVVFLVVFIGLSFAAADNQQLATFMSKTGANPFEVASAAGVFTYPKVKAAMKKSSSGE